MHPDHKLYFNLSQRPPVEGQIKLRQHELHHLSERCWLSSIVLFGLFMASCLFFDLHFDKMYDLVTLAAADLCVFTLLISALGLLIYFTFTKMREQLLNEVTDDVLLKLTQLCKQQPKVTWYINQIIAQGRKPVQAESKIVFYYANGKNDLVEVI